MRQVQARATPQVGDDRAGGDAIVEGGESPEEPGCALIAPFRGALFVDHHGLAVHPPIIAR